MNNEKEGLDINVNHLATSFIFYTLFSSINNFNFINFAFLFLLLKLCNNDFLLELLY